MLISSILFIIVLANFAIWQNNSIEVSNFEFYNSEIPSDLNNFKIVHISDLHNKMFGKEQSNILDKLELMEELCI